MAPMATENGVEEATVEAAEAPQVPFKPTPSRVGIIYPPPEIRSIVDKTAKFVGKNGLQFEERVRMNEANNPKFNFLKPNDPYHAYYQHKIRECQEEESKPESEKQQQVSGPQTATEASASRPMLAIAEPPKEPPPEFEFTADPATINAQELDIIALTAQFVARNGRQFLNQLMIRESRNPQFDFLKPQHSQFHYFTKLIEQYTKVMIPQRSILKVLHDDATDYKKVMSQLTYRAEWCRHEQRIRERVEAAAEKERVAYAQIDWHDFVVVQTVDFAHNEHLNLPPPCTPADVGARLLAQQRGANKPTPQTHNEEMEVESSSDEEEEEEQVEEVEVEKPPPPEEPEQPPMPEAMRPTDAVVRHDYDPRVVHAGTAAPHGVVTDSTKWIISPLTGERIPADKLKDHMRFNTVDPQYFEQKEREKQQKLDEEQVFAAGVDISQNIGKFAERRTDIFGREEETAIGQKIGEDPEKALKDQKTIWDGHMSSIEATRKAAAAEALKKVAPPPPKGGTGGNTQPIGPRPTPPAQAPRPPAPSFVAPMQPQMVLLRQTVPMVPVVPVLAAPQPRIVVPMPVIPQQVPRPAPPQPPPMVQSAHPEAPQDGPASKRARTEDTLVPEAQWISTHEETIDLRVNVPSVPQPDKPEWKLNGQLLTFNGLPLKDPVSVIKSKITEVTLLPSSKQKLLHDGLFIKDSNSLAFYNMENGSVVQLQLKERGGRKK